LQPNIDKEAIVKHTRPWQQVLMFFARTQKQHAWKSPQYRFKRRQREVWEALVREATRTAAADAAEIDEEGEEQEDDNEPELEVDETDQATEAAPDQSAASARPEHSRKNVDFL
jgi:hypothetical protein